MAMTTTAATRKFVPVYIDHFQAAAYQHVATIERDGVLVAVFGDGTERPSVYRSVAAMLEAGQRDYRERVREIK